MPDDAIHKVAERIYGELEHFRYILTWSPIRRLIEHTLRENAPLISDSLFCKGYLEACDRFKIELTKEQREIYERRI